ncbi:MAG: hypothetical protein JO197_17730 [Acidobacteria bacterium]|nr:hypothetical protein [Acidobacteriota bacterium]MBV9478945.1 hypothetical protein [Acidobacteriota bacterium]
MRKAMVAFLMFFVTASAFAHAGHVHTYMGTVTTLHGLGTFVMKTTDGHDVTVQTSSSTRWTDAEDHAAKPADLAAGMRVVVKMSVDGKTAGSVKMAIPPRR